MTDHQQPQPVFLPPVAEPRPVFDAPGAGEPASYGQRVGAALLDALVGLSIGLALGVVFGLLWQVAIGGSSVDAEGIETDHGVYAGAAVAVLAALLYPIIMTGITGGLTVGKKALGIRIVRDVGDRIGWGHAVGREVAKFVMGLFTIPIVLSYLWPLWQPENRTLHDLMASTKVVKDTGSPQTPTGTDAFGRPV